MVNNASIAAAAALMLCLPGVGFAQDLPEVETSEVVGLSCDLSDLSAELRLICDDLAGSISAVMAAPVEVGKVKRRALKPVPGGRAIKAELTTGGLADKRDLRDPFAVDPDRSVGVVVRSASLPVNLTTTMVQPGSPTADPVLNWEMKAERGLTANQSGMFLGGAAAGGYQHDSNWNNFSAFAGVREVVKAADNVRFGSEITPRLYVDGATLEPSLTLEPKLTTSSDFERVGGTDLKATLSADLSYSMPMEGDASTYAGFRLALSPR